MVFKLTTLQFVFSCQGKFTLGLLRSIPLPWLVASKPWHFFPVTPFGGIRRDGSVRGVNFLGQKSIFFSPWQEICIFWREIGIIWQEIIHFGENL